MKTCKKRVCLIMLIILAFVLPYPCSYAESDNVFRSGIFEYVLQDDGTIAIESCLLTDERVLEIPSQLDGFTVTSLIRPEVDLNTGRGNYFALSNHVKKLILPSTLTKIQGNLFSDLHKLEEIVVSPDHPSFAVIDNVLFSKADKKMICFPLGRKPYYYTIPDGILEIGDCAFKDCKIKSITIPESVISIGNYAFEDSEIYEFIIPKSVRNLGMNPFHMGSMPLNKPIRLSVSADNPFLYVENNVLVSKEDRRLVCFLKGVREPLKECYVPDGIKTIGEYAFAGCYGVNNVILPSTVETICDNAFYMCSDFQRIEMSDGVKKIGENAFKLCQDLSEIIWSANLAEIGDSAFLHCDSLKNVTLPDNVAVIGSEAFAFCVHLKEVYLPSRIDSIPENLFSNCSSLIEVNIPEGVVSIGRNAFYSCSDLKHINWNGEESRLPESLDKIGELAFAECSRLQELYLPASISEIENSVGISESHHAFEKDTNLVVTVERNSYAAEYCEQNKISYVYPDSNDWLTN